MKCLIRYVLAPLAAFAAVTFCAQTAEAHRHWGYHHVGPPVVVAPYRAYYAPPVVVAPMPVRVYRPWVVAPVLPAPVVPAPVMPAPAYGVW